MSWRSWWTVVSLLTFHQTFAWSGEGHFQIALVAEGYLREKLRKKVRGLLKGDLVDFAHYEEKITAKLPETGSCHFHHQTPEWTCDGGIGRQGKVHCDGSEAGYFSLLCGVSLTFQKFAHDALMQEYPKSDYFRMRISDYWGNFEGAKYAEMLKTPEDELRWLAIFIGDMHQPLHWLRGDFEYGRNMTIVVKGQEYSLFEYWERELPQLFKLNDFHGDPRMYKKWHHFKEHPAQIFSTWGIEQSSKACDIYANLKGLGSGGSRVEVDTKTILQWRKDYEALVLQAGERLAQVMSELLTHRKHEAGHKHGRGLHHPHSSAKHLVTNTLLAIPTVLLWLVGLHWHYQGKMPNVFNLFRNVSAAPQEHRKE